MKAINKKPLIILTAGGTGGHVFPAESLAEELQRRGYNLAFITDKRGKENGKGKLSEIKNYAVLSGALVGKSKLFKIKSLIKTFFGTIQSVFILFKNKPKCVVGFGGYASFPCCLAAILLGIDLVLHEQNSVMSRTNRFLSKHASLIALSFRKTKFAPSIKTVLTGMPVRKNIIDIKDRLYPSFGDTDKFNIIVLGGSQGTKIFSEVIPEAIKKLNKKLQKKIKIYQQCRADDLENVKANYKNVEAETILSPFFSNMPEIYSQAHLIISRSGASSVCEISTVGIPSILIPLPIAADDHQTSNAKELGDVGAAIVIKQDNFSTNCLKDLLEDFLENYAKLKVMSHNAQQVSIANASSRLADALEIEVINKN